MLPVKSFLRRTALAKNAKTSTPFDVITSNLVYGLINGVEFDYFYRIWIFVLFKKICLVEVQHWVP